MVFGTGEAQAKEGRTVVLAMLADPPSSLLIMAAPSCICDAASRVEVRVLYFSSFSKSVPIYALRSFCEKLAIAIGEKLVHSVERIMSD